MIVFAKVCVFCVICVLLGQSLTPKEGGDKKRSYIK
jgi:hypothetical protein